MADNPYAAFATPVQAPANPYAAFATPVAAAPPTEGGGVTDNGPVAPQAPLRGDVINPVNMPQDPAAGYVMTRLRNVGTGMASLPRGLADLVKYGATSLGANPDDVKNALNLNPVFGAAQHMPSGEDLNRSIEAGTGFKPVNTPGRAGKVLDSAVEFGLGGAVMPGGIRNLVPGAVGGAVSETAGQATEGTKYEPLARMLGAVVPGGLAALVQSGSGNVIQAIKNLAPNVDETSAKVIARALIRDNDTANALATRQADLGPGAMAVEAGGPNVRGTLRGSIAAPGPSRTTAQNAFDERIGGSNSRTTSALDTAVSPNGSLAGTIDELSDIRAQQARPLYEKAGIPPHPESRITAMDEPPTWNTRNVTSPRLEALLRDSPDVQTAIASARRLPEYKDVPTNSMTMMDKAYKHLEGMEQEAIRGGNNTRARDLGTLRRDFQTALTDANPDYQRALNAFAGPSKLIDAGETAKAWFTKNVDPAMVAREFQAMSPAEQEAARVGVRDWARNKIGTSDRGVAAERVWAGGNNRERLQAILGSDEFSTLEKSMGIEKNAIATARDINVGSRTAPMLNEQADNALAESGILADLLKGHPIRAAGKFTGRAVERIGEGKSEAVNARIAEMLTATDPEKVGMVNALAERARLAELAKRSGRRNALVYGGGVAPSANALVNGQRQ